MSYRDEEAQALKLFVIFSRAYRAIEDEVKKDISSYGLNPTEFGVLELLYHKGPQPLQQIGDKILITSGSITYVVDKLVKKGLLVREPCEKDRRISYATLTDQGSELIAEIFPKHRSQIAALFKGLSLEEKEELIHLLKKAGMPKK